MKDKNDENKESIVNKHLLWLVSFVFSISIILSGCGSGSNNSDSSQTEPPQIDPPSNSPPTAMAGDDLSVDEQTMVTLEGSGTDSDGTIESYSWVQVSGESVNLENPNSANVSFTAPTTTEQLSLVFRLTVTDDQSATHSDEITVAVNPVNAIPTISQLEHLGVIESLVTQVTVNANDEDGEITSYLWEQTSGPDIGLALENRQAASIEFTAPNTSSNDELVFTVMATDNEAATASIEVRVTLYDSKGVPQFNRLTDTGMLTCGNYAVSSEPNDVHANNVDCSFTEFPESYPVPLGQDGHYGSDTEDNDNSDGRASLRYLKLASDGSILPSDAPDWSCVLDQVTGLTWQIKTEGANITALQNRFSWYDTNNLTNGGEVGEINDDVSCTFSGTACNTEQYVEDQNNNFICESNNWRLPQPNELMSLMTLQEGAGVKIDTNYFPNINLGNGTFWSSSTYLPINQRAYYFDFASARLRLAEKSDFRGVLVVRNASSD